jgi:predicted transcriptional regulator
MTTQQLQRIMQLLRDVGETHKNDTIAVEAARLSYRLESLRAEPLSDTDKQLIIYSRKWLTSNPRHANVSA